MDHPKSNVRPAFELPRAKRLTSDHGQVDWSPSKEKKVTLVALLK